MSPALGLAAAAVVLVALAAALPPAEPEGPAIIVPAIVVPADCTAVPMSDLAPVPCAGGS